MKSTKNASDATAAGPVLAVNCSSTTFRCSGDFNHAKSRVLVLAMEPMSVQLSRNILFRSRLEGPVVLWRTQIQSGWEFCVTPRSLRNVLPQQNVVCTAACDVVQGSSRLTSSTSCSRLANGRWRSAMAPNDIGMSGRGAKSSYA